jgi:hypothetical protein
MKNILFIATAVMLFSCAGETEKTAVPETQPVAQSAPPAATMPTLKFTAADYKTLAAGQFISFLEENAASGWVAVEKAPDKWITRKDVDALMELIHSDKLSAGVVLNTTNIIPPANVRSTVGVEAMLLIDSYRKGTYPAYLSSLDYAKALTPDKGTKVLMLKPNPQLTREIEAWYKTLK